MGLTKAAVELRKMRRIEAVKTSWRTICRINGTERNTGGLKKVVSPNKNDEWSEKLTKTDVEQGTLQENERRFTQAKSTPMVVLPLSNEFGLLGNDPKVDQLRTGKYTPSHFVEDWMTDVLQHLTIPKDTSPKV